MLFRSRNHLLPPSRPPFPLPPHCRRLHPPPPHLPPQHLLAVVPHAGLRLRLFKFCAADDAQPPAPTLFHPDAAPLPASLRPDMNTVRRPSRSRRISTPPQVSQKPQPFDLQDCPAFYPSPEEFKDPMSYIRAISPKAREFGIAKIIPPETRRMPFVTDTEVRKIFLLSPQLRRGGSR
jgi:hypothetical protein